MDEVLLVIKGFIDRQRVERRNAYLIHCSLVGDKAVDMFEYLPLPYDDELRQEPVNDVSAEEFYKQTTSTGYLENQWWINAVA